MSAYLSDYVIALAEKSHLVAFISRISTLGMVLAVSVLVLVTSIMNGFDTALKERILGIVPHVTLTQPKPLMDWRAPAAKALTHEAVAEAMPFSFTQAMLLDYQQIKPVMVLAYDPVYEPKQSVLSELLKAQSVDVVLQDNEVIISKTLANKLNKKMGEQLTLMVAQPEQDTPAMFTVLIKGLVETGTQFDQKLVLANPKQVALLQNWPEGAVNGIRLYLSDIFKAHQVANQLTSTLQIGQSTYWMQAQGNLYQAVQMSRKMVVFLVLIIIAIAAFNLVSTLILAVNEKASDIAILKTLGCSGKQILTIFVYQALLIGFMGVTMGLIFGLLATVGIGPFLQWLEALLHYQFLETEVYPIDYLPVDIRLSHISIIVSFSFVLSVLASIIPAIRAMRLEPAKVLRYE